MIKELKLNKKQWIIIGVLTVPFLLRFISYPIFISALEAINQHLLNIASLLLDTLGVEVEPAIDKLLLRKGFIIEMPYPNLNLKFIGILCLIIISNKNFKYKSVGLFIIWVLIAHLTRIIIWGILAEYGNTGYSFEHDKIYRILLCSFPVILYWKNVKAAITIKQKNNIENILLKLCVILLFYNVMSFLIHNIGDGGQSIRDILADWILNLSKYSLEYLGYSVDIAGRRVFNSHTYIYILDGCIGIDIILVFCGIFLFYETISWRLLLYCLSGVVLIFILNAMRITYLFIHVSEHGNDSALFNLHHELYNTFIYAFIVTLWYLWFFYFKKEDNKS